MERIERHSLHLSVKGLNGISGLVTYGRTVEELEEEIDRSNAHVMEKGYDPEQYLIVLHCIKTVYDRSEDQDFFVSKYESERVIETYPAKLPEVITTEEICETTGNKKKRFVV